MQPFAPSRADDPAKAITAHAQHPGLGFTAGASYGLALEGISAADVARSGAANR